MGTRSYLWGWGCTAPSGPWPPQPRSSQNGYKGHFSILGFFNAENVVFLKNKNKQPLNHRKGEPFLSLRALPTLPYMSCRPWDSPAALLQGTPGSLHPARQPGPVLRDLPPALGLASCDAGRRACPSPNLPHSRDSRRLMLGLKTRAQSLLPFPPPQPTAGTGLCRGECAPRSPPGRELRLCAEMDRGCRALGMASWAYARPLRWGVLSTPRAKGRRGEGAPWLTRAPGNVVPENLDVGSQSSQVDLRPHVGAWAAGHCPGTWVPLPGHVTGMAMPHRKFSLRVDQASPSGTTRSP